MRAAEAVVAEMEAAHQSEVDGLLDSRKAIRTELDEAREAVGESQR
jgi:hypothetical protein